MSIEHTRSVLACAAILTTASFGCERLDCGDYRAFFEDQRLELANGPVAVGREGAIVRVGPERIGLSPKVTPVESTTHEDLLAIEQLNSTGPDREVVIITGRAGTILVSGDRGESWSQPALPSGFGADLHGLNFGCRDLDTGRPGMAVGAHGSALRSDDRGQSWTDASTDLDVTLRAVAVLSQTEAVVVGDNGTILRSNDLGATWVPVPAASEDDLLQVAGRVENCLGDPKDPMTSDYVFAAGRQGDLLVSRDRGETWEVFAHFSEGPVTEAFPSVVFEWSGPPVERLGASVISGASSWTLYESGRWVRERTFPAAITDMDPSSGIVVAGGTLYAPHYDPGCL